MFKKTIFLLLRNNLKSTYSFVCKVVNVLNDFSNNVVKVIFSLFLRNNLKSTYSFVCKVVNVFSDFSNNVVKVIFSLLLSILITACGSPEEAKESGIEIESGKTLITGKVSNYETLKNKNFDISFEDETYELNLDENGNFSFLTEIDDDYNDELIIMDTDKTYGIKRAIETKSGAESLAGSLSLGETVEMEFMVKDSIDKNNLDGVQFLLYGSSYIYVSSLGKVELALPVGEYRAEFIKSEYNNLVVDFNTESSEKEFEMIKKTMPYVKTVELILENEKSTNLKMTVSKNIEYMIVSEDPLLLNENWHDFDYYNARISENDDYQIIEMDYDFENYGANKIYAKFSTGAEGAESSLASADIDIDGEDVEFEDQVLKELLLTALGKETSDKINDGDIASIEVLNLSSKNISNIKGLENFINLKELDLSSNILDDISALSELNKMETLILSNNRLEDFKDINMPELKTLNLSGNSIKEVLDFNQYSKLIYLDLNASKIMEMPLFDKCIELNYLNLSDNSLKGEIDISTLKNLENFDIYNNLISKIKGAASSIKQINLYRNPIENHVFINALKNLEDLYIGNNGETKYLMNIDFLTGLNNLGLLFLGTDKVEDISLLDSLESLTAVYLHKDSLNDASNLIINNRKDITWNSNGFPNDPELIGIEDEDERYYYEISIGNRDNNYQYHAAIDGDYDSYDLEENLKITYSELGDHNLTIIVQNTENDLSNSRTIKFKVSNRIYNFDPKLEAELFEYLDEEKGYIIREENLQSIKELKLTNKNIESLNELENIIALEKLDLSINSLENVTEISSLYNLKELNLSKNLIKSILDCSKLLNLEDFNLSSNYGINDFMNLNDLKKLKILDISKTEFSNLSEIVLLELLTELNISDTKLLSLEGIENFKNLEKLFIAGEIMPENLENVVLLENLNELYILSSNLSEDNYKVISELEEKGVKIYYSSEKPETPVLNGISNDDMKATYTINIDNYNSFNTYFMTIDDVEYEISDEDIVYSELGEHKLIIYAKKNGIRSDQLEISFEVANDIVEFSSDLFRDLIIEKLKEINPEFEGEIIKVSDAESIEELILSDKEISDISGIGSLKSLKKLNLSKNNIVDVSEIVYLDSLEWLSLSRNKIEDIGGMESLENLNWISLSSNEIVDISALKNSINLEELWLWGNKIEDISILKDMENLQKIYIYSNKIKSVPIDAFEKLVDLEILQMQDNLCADISFLENCINLKELNLSSNGISTIEYLSKMTNLENLNLSKNKYIFDITGLEGLTSLVELNLGDNVLKTIDVLKNLENLETLYLYENYLTDKDGEIAILDPLKDLKKLKKLGLSTNNRNLNDSGIMDISPLKDLDNLEWLNLSENSILETDTIKYLQNLKELSIGDNKIINGLAISELVNLEKLTIYKNNIYEDYNWSRLINLVYLDIEGNPSMTNIDFMSSYTKLENLDIRGIKFTEAQSIKAKLIIDILKQNDCEILTDLE